METGTMQGLFRFLTRAFEELEAPIPFERLEELAVLIYSAMSNPARNYHNLDHVFNFTQPPDPIIYLAAVFHDIIYYQVDDGILPELERNITPYLRREHGSFFLSNPIPEDDERVRWVSEYFGYSPGNKITFAAGLNEFLSALVTVKMLGGLISDHNLFQIVACIEATIPFRGKDNQGRDQFDVVAERVREMRKKYVFLGTPEQIDAALQRAVIFSNQDVETFKEKDVARFLVITFKLLPESNVALRKRGVYSIRDYRIGLQNMERFLRTLNPDNVFNCYKGVPPPDEYKEMVFQTHINLQTALKYLQVKLLAMSLLEGLAMATGGDAPLSLFMGDLPRPGVEIQRMEDYLPDIPLPDFIDPQSDLLRLFSVGFTELGFDLPYSPTSLFIYKSLTENEQDVLFVYAQELFAGKMPADEFLKTVPARLLGPVAKAVAELVFTRRVKLLSYANSK